VTIVKIALFSASVLQVLVWQLVYIFGDFYNILCIVHYRWTSICNRNLPMLPVINMFICISVI